MEWVLLPSSGPVDLTLRPSKPTPKDSELDKNVGRSDEEPPFQPKPEEERYSWPRINRVATPVKKLAEYKLETEFHEGYVVHTTYEWELSTRVWQKTTWKQIDIIGAGASGQVWMEKTPEGKVRAVKRMSRRSMATPDFNREILALVKLKEHPHLFLELYGWYENQQDIFVATEYIEHGNLGDYIKGSSTIRSEAPEITRQILEGLALLHEKAICHRDLKPENVLIASVTPIWVKIADFGISKRAKDTVLRTACGTEGYLAPELIGVLPKHMRTRPGTFTYALDLWSLGCLVHEILTSLKPFIETIDDDDDYTGVDTFSEQQQIDLGTLMDYCKGKIDFPTELLREAQVSEEGIAFVISLLAPNPAKRPTAIAALQASWLREYKNVWFENLKSEFSSLGADLDLGGNHGPLARQAGKIDIVPLLPPAAAHQFPSLLLQAAGGGYQSALSALLRSPSCNSVNTTIRESLSELVESNERVQAQLALLLEDSSDLNTAEGNDVQKTQDEALRSMMFRLGQGRSNHQPNLIKLVLESIPSVNPEVVEDGWQANVESSIRAMMLQLAESPRDIRTEVVKLLQGITADGSSSATEGGKQASMDESVRAMLSQLTHGPLDGQADILKLLLGGSADGGRDRTALYPMAGIHDEILQPFVDVEI